MVGALVLAAAPLAALKRVLGVFLLVVVAWRHLRRRPKPPSDNAFVAVGAVSGAGSALLGSVGPLTAPFFLARGLVRAAYVGTEAACALAMHLAKIAGYGAGSLLGTRVVLLGVALAPATFAGAWCGRALVGRMSEKVFVILVEAGLVVAAVLFLVGL